MEVSTLWALSHSSFLHTKGIVCRRQYQVSVTSPGSGWGGGVLVAAVWRSAGRSATFSTVSCTITCSLTLVSGTPVLHKHLFQTHLYYAQHHTPVSDTPVLHTASHTCQKTCSTYCVTHTSQTHLPTYLHMATSEMWCWSDKRRILTKLSLCYSIVYYYNGAQ